jgi:hypothetical protein
MTSKSMTSIAAAKNNRGANSSRITAKENSEFISTLFAVPGYSGNDSD